MRAELKVMFLLFMCSNHFVGVETTYFSFNF